MALTLHLSLHRPVSNEGCTENGESLRMPRACRVDRFDRRYIAAPRGNRDATGLPRGTSRSVQPRRAGLERNDPRGKPVAFSAFAEGRCSDKRNDPRGKPVAFTSGLSARNKSEQRRTFRIRRFCAGQHGPQSARRRRRTHAAPPGAVAILQLQQAVRRSRKRRRSPESIRRGRWTSPTGGAKRRSSETTDTPVNALAPRRDPPRRFSISRCAKRICTEATAGAELSAGRARAPLAAALSHARRDPPQTLALSAIRGRTG
jgi:hypothetical protein